MVGVRDRGVFSVVALAKRAGVGDQERYTARYFRFKFHDNTCVVCACSLLRLRRHLRSYVNRFPFMFSLFSAAYISCSIA